MCYRWGLILWVLSCFLCSAAEAQNISNEGKDFWAVFPSHDPSGGNNNTPISYANVRIWVTSKTSSRVTVSCRGYSETKDILSNVPVPFDVTRAEAYIAHSESNMPLPARAIHIAVQDGFEKVAVYAHIFAGFRSAASLILPVESLGQKYFSMNYSQTGNGAANFLEIIATEDNTKVLITEKSGNVLPVTLAKAGDVYQYMPGGQADLTGVAVNIDPSSPDNCNKRFAVFSGSTSLTIGSCGTSRDPLFQQLYPTISWGREYAIVPFADRLYIIRVLAQENNTTFQFNGETFILNAGQYYESPQLSEAAFVTADKKISVAQYSLTQNCSSAIGAPTPGDPEMVMLNPVEFNIKEVTLFSSTDQQISSRYINVFMKTAATASFMVNGQAPNASWTVLPSRPEYSYIQINITNNANQVSHLTASDGFNAMAYGFGSTESYAYSAGTNLAANNYLLIHNKSTNIDAPNACINQASSFKIILPYQPLKIIWQLDNAAAVEHMELHQTQVTQSGTLYTYTYGTDVTFNQLETHRMLVKAQMPNLENCLGGEIEYNFIFEVYPIPTPDFTMAAISCADTDVQFTDVSSSNIADKPLNKWLWDFGDGNTSTAQHPKHIYTSSGTFTVTFSAGRDDGCMSDVKTAQITILPKVNASFSAPLKGCINTEAAFLDQSASASGPIVEWLWDFGDGSLVSNLQHPKHTYLSTGTFTVSLVSKTANGCQSLPFKKDIVINSLPVVDFTLPKVCVGDVTATFVNKTENEDKTTTGLTYFWNFGDATALAADNVSSQTDGSHKYNTAGPYTVTLTATNANGCSFSVSKQFTVNGSQIVPVFSIVNKNALCSNRKIRIEDKSTIDEGKIIKLVWFIDDVEKLEVIDPVQGTFYEFDPPVATSATPKQITVKLIAYSGERCVEQLTENVTLYPAPALIFDPISPVCLNSAVFQLQSARETLGIPQGSPIYSGQGIISADGYFDPKLAGVGTHTLSYHFISAAGCEESITQTITVQPLPELSLKSDIFILAGGEVKIDAFATGNNLSYKWVPVAGLDRDNILNPTVKIDEDKTYTLTVTTGAGCSISAQVKVHVVNSIDAANAFSPNGDGVNDVWLLKYIESYPNVTVDVFNRYGEKVFFSQGYSIPFDGNYNGRQLPVGTYFYMINPKNGKKIITGALTLIR